MPGSSPHVRGARNRDYCRRLDYGIIPACAGSTRVRSSGSSPNRDHPRMCGEHAPSRMPLARAAGSSPHVRGALFVHRLEYSNRGIIPACAGSTWCWTIREQVAGDHPRMCGEHSASMRTAAPASGSSPHVRGARGGGLNDVDHDGIIPACAGSTTSFCSACVSRRDHPRMCGEHWSSKTVVCFRSGSSPHVRGARSSRTVGDGIPGIIPACAGSTRSRPACTSPCRDHPRMCGEHSTDTIDTLVLSGSSPHVRGALY